MPTKIRRFALGPDAVGHAERGETTSLTEVFARLLLAQPYVAIRQPLTLRNLHLTLLLDK